MIHQAIFFCPSSLYSEFYLISGTPCLFPFPLCQDFCKKKGTFSTLGLISHFSHPSVSLKSADIHGGDILGNFILKKSQKIFFFHNDDDMQEKRSHCSGRSGGGDNDIAGICRSDAIQFTADCNRIADRHVAHEPQSKSSCGHACLKPGRARSHAGRGDPRVNRR